MTEKLPVLSTIGEAWKSVKQHGRRMLPYVGLLILLGLCMQGISFASGFWDVMIDPERMKDFHPNGFGMLSMLLVELVAIIALIPTITSFQRLVVQGNEARVGLAYKREEWLVVRSAFTLFFSYIGLLVALLILEFITIALASALKAGWLAAILNIAGLIFLFVVVFRLTLMLPAAAVGDRLSLKACLRLSKSNSLRLFAVALLPLLPLIVSQLGLEVMIIDFNHPGGPKLMTLPTWVWVSGGLVFSVIYFITMALTSAAWALAYRHLKGNEPAPEVLPEPVPITP